MLLRSKDKQTLISIFSQLHYPIEVIAYGSRVNNTAHDTSDLDLVIKSQKADDLTHSTLTSIKEQITESNIPVLVELRNWYSLPQNFIDQINKKSEVLFKNY